MCFNLGLSTLFPSILLSVMILGVFKPPCSQLLTPNYTHYNQLNHWNFSKQTCWLQFFYRARKTSKPCFNGHIIHQRFQILHYSVVWYILCRGGGGCSAGEEQIETNSPDYGQLTDCDFWEDRVEDSTLSCLIHALFCTIRIFRKENPNQCVTKH